MHQEILDTLKQYRKETGLPDDLSNISIVEFGSFDMNGSPRSVFRGAKSYLGVDVRPGPGVDIVAKNHDAPVWKADVVVCCQAFEHDPHWLRTVYKACQLIGREGGLLFFTWAGLGYGVHGLDYAVLDEDGNPYYRNLSVEMVASAVKSFLPDVEVHTSYGRGTLDAGLWARVEAPEDEFDFVREACRAYKGQLRNVLRVGRGLASLFARNVTVHEDCSPYVGLFDAMVVKVPEFDQDTRATVARFLHRVRPGGLIVVDARYVGVEGFDSNETCIQGFGFGDTTRGIQVRGTRMEGSACLGAFARSRGLDWSLRVVERNSTSHDADPSGNVYEARVVIDGKEYTAKGSSMDVASEKLLWQLARCRLLDLTTAR